MYTQYKDRGVIMLGMLVMTSDRRMWKPWRLLAIWSIGSFFTFLLMFGQLHIPLSLFLAVALVVGVVGMAFRKAIAEAGEMNAYRVLAAIGLVGLVLLFVGVLPNWKLPIAPFSYVETGLWGGIPVTIILATYGLLFAFPYGILLALGRAGQGSRPISARAPQGPIGADGSTHIAAWSPPPA